MNSRLDALLSAYKVEPKKLNTRKKQTKIKSGPINQSNSMGLIKQKSALPQIPKTFKKQPFKNTSVQPSARCRSDFAFDVRNKLVHNTSFDDCMNKLENITVRNSNARLDLISIQKRMIELGVNRNLKAISEADESKNEKEKNFDSNIDLMFMKIENKKKLNERMRSLDNLLVY